ncbi:SLATT domain-containing protein [Thalassobacillus pellis]|uniref:SLATT domain-containing protein n=1 Tax=Thalassobacillus pellis TaxID=748008 RepID=UPI00195FBC0B|nr:SLATT domain-containing protein [Thalassobacillus pellis]MBM7554444.1 ABC-type antimicrobial peptide transport system permease subunit [Thalassobacillus pellis]
MDRNSLLKSIAIKGYDIGFGAKKHFATFDMACKVPNFIALGTLTAGVVQLGFEIPGLISKILSVLLISIGIASIFINHYADKKQEYVDAGVTINTIYQELRNLYFKVQGTREDDEERLEEHEQAYNELIKRFNETGITQQIVFSDWYAHYKFFVQLETDWIEEQRPFKFKDKMPLAFRWALYLLVGSLAIVIVTVVVLFIYNLLI